MTIEIIILLLLTIYAGLHLLVLTNNNSVFTSNTKLKVAGNNDLVKFSIVVAAKNESHNIPVIISALEKINYPNANYEVIIVDDNSADDTFAIAEELCSTIHNFYVCKTTDKNYSGKRGALDYGISLARNQNILITDADCIPNGNWLNECSQRTLADCDIYFGIAPFYQRKNLVNKISCYENFTNSLLALSALKLNFPYTASARNFGFNKGAYNKVGGYSKTLDTISGDDDLLLREAVKNNLKVCTLTHPGSFVYSETKNTFKDYISQRARHTQTSFYYPLKQKLFLAAWHLLNISFIISPLLIFVNNLFVLPFLVKIILDITRTTLYQNKFGYKFKIYEAIYLQILYEILIVVHFFNAMYKKIEWK